MYGDHASECLFLPKPLDYVRTFSEGVSAIAQQPQKCQKNIGLFFFFLVINISQYISSRQNGSLGICSPAFTPTVSAEHDLALTVPMLFKFQLLKMFRCICFNKCLGEFGILKLGSQKLSETFISVQVSKPCRNISALRQEAPCGIRASPDRVHPILICQQPSVHIPSDSSFFIL